jgi:MerR family transcriptional regulator, thiopeptide resistance regulator
VSIRTLRFYDQIGLLKPSQRSESGYRLYNASDLTRLQQILSLKLLGFSLSEIKAFLSASPLELREALDQQREMLTERRRHIDIVLDAIDHARGVVSSHGSPEQSVVEVIRAIQMSQNNDWQSKYFNDEQRQAMDELSKGAYSQEARDALDARPVWTEADQKRVDGQYAALYDGVREAVAAGEDPGSARGQELAAQAIRLIEAFTQGNPAVAAGLQKFWQAHEQLPREQRPIQTPLSEEEESFLNRAKQLYQERR